MSRILGGKAYCATKLVETPCMDKLRIDKWLWAARFYKTRSLATDDIHKGRVQVNGQDAKPSREVKPGDTVHIRIGQVERTVRVMGLSGMRGPAQVAQALYEETADSQAARALAAEQRRLSPEPAQSQPQGRPTKRDRRHLQELQGNTGGWDQRWSASIE